MVGGASPCIFMPASAMCLGFVLRKHAKPRRSLMVSLLSCEGRWHWTCWHFYLLSFSLPAAKYFHVIMRCLCRASLEVYVIALQTCLHDWVLICRSLCSLSYIEKNMKPCQATLSLPLYSGLCHECKEEQLILFFICPEIISNHPNHTRLSLQQCLALGTSF